MYSQNLIKLNMRVNKTWKGSNNSDNLRELERTETWPLLLYSPMIALRPQTTGQNLSSAARSWCRRRRRTGIFNNRIAWSGLWKTCSFTEKSPRSFSWNSSTRIAMKFPAEHHWGLEADGIIEGRLVIKHVNTVIARTRAGTRRQLGNERTY